MLFTIGYESATSADFIGTLQAVGVKIVADIRERPQSRRPGFSKTALSEALKEAGIEYLHFRELGDPREGREAARAGDRDGFLKIFAAVMGTPEAQAALTELEQLAAEQSVCLVCYERNHHDCHRKIVADALESRVGIRARHIGVRPIELPTKRPGSMPHPR